MVFFPWGLNMLHKCFAIRVEGVRFNPMSVHGDFSKMLADPLYTNSVMLFNDNHGQFCLAKYGTAWFHDEKTHSPGGGNACVRPFQRFDHSIGMPTGPYVSLEQEVSDAGVSRIAKDMIDEACYRTIDLFLRRPDKELLYYSVDPTDPPGSKRIGLAIFACAVGEDVVQYISECIQSLPLMLEYKRLH